MDHKRKTDFTMPYKSSGIIISGTQYDRRQKLTPFQKAEIFHRYMTEAVSQRRRLITFIVNPESEERNKELLRENKAKGLYKYDRKKHTENIRNHRRYKQRLFQEGKIILKDG